MSERGSNLAAKTEEQIADTVEFLSGLDDRDLQVSCTDERGTSTVGAVAAHVAAGYGQLRQFLAAKPAPSHSAPGSGGHGIIGSAFRSFHEHASGHGHNHGHDHEPADVQETITVLNRDGAAAADLLRHISDERLDEPAPRGIVRFADGKRPVGQILAGVIDHQTSHLNNMKRSVAAARTQEAI